MTLEENSSYNPKDNTILISKKKIERGDSYAAEVGHFLRDYSLGNLYKWREDQSLSHLKVHEFFDRATYVVAKKLAKGTDLEKLFQGKVEPDFSNHEDVKEYARMGMRIRKHLQDARAGKVKGAYAGHAVESAETDLFQFRSHTPYRYADQLTADKILAHRDFYSMPDREVEKEFFHKRKDMKGKKLEGMLALLFFFIFLGIFLFFLRQVKFFS